MDRAQRILATVTLVLAALGNGLAGATPEQTVGGSILIPTAADECLVVTGTAEWAARSAWLFEYAFVVTPGTRGMRFDLRPDLPGSDIDIRFEGPNLSKRFEARGLGGERGRVPAKATTATVCLFAGAATSFTYRAGGSVQA
jgi:hypothetical protein